MIRRPRAFKREHILKSGEGIVPQSLYRLSGRERRS